MGLMRGLTAPGFLAHRGLVAAASGGAIAETGLLAALAPAARVLGPQVTALTPLAVYHDLRWLNGYALPWPAFTVLAAALVVGRAGVSAGLIRLAWPAGSPPPPLPDLLWSCAMLTAFAGLVLTPAVSLMVGASVVPFSWPFLASVVLMLLLVLPLSHGGVQSHWWQTLPPATTAGWLLADFVVLTIAAAAIGRLPIEWAVVAAGVAGLFNARAWYGLATAAAHGPQRTPTHLPVAPIAAIAAIALVIGMARLVFSQGVRSAAPHRSRDAQASAAPLTSGRFTSGATGTGTVQAGLGRAGTGRAELNGRTGTGRAGLNGRAGTGRAVPPGRPARGRMPVLVIAGFGASCCNHAGDVHRVLPGWWVQQFSYLGLAKRGAPIPHGASASNLPLTVLGNRVAEQVWRLHAQTGRPVSIVAESEGTLGVDAMLALHPHVPLGSVVLLSPIVAPGQGSYPPLTRDDLDLVTGAELQEMVRVVGELSPFGAAGAETFVNSVDSVGARFASTAHQRLAGSIEFVPLADAVTLPACTLPANVRVIPALHGELLGDPAALAAVRAFLTHRPVQSRPLLRTTAEIVAAGAAAWRMPPLSDPSPPCPP